MEKVRLPFQGISNIIRFNWHYYVASLFFALSLFAISINVGNPLQEFLFLFGFLNISITVISLLVSYYIYDLSGLYNLSWIGVSTNDKVIVNINAGFDETSALLKDKFLNAKLFALDFYDPLQHTEISIKRARKAYPVYLGTKQIQTTCLQFNDGFADKIFLIFAAHEIRDEEERLGFFKELNRILKPGGQIYLVEHLRDPINFLAYNIGFFHFHSRSTWCRSIKMAHLNLRKETKLTPFISIFTIEKNGVPL